MSGVNPKQAFGAAKYSMSNVPRGVLGEVGLAMGEGAHKYGRHNYRSVGKILASVYYDAAMRHLDAWWEGQDTDPASGIHHVTKAIAGLVVLRDAMMCGTFFDDRPPPLPEGWQERLNAQHADMAARLHDVPRVDPYLNAAVTPVLGRIEPSPLEPARTRAEDARWRSIGGLLKPDAPASPDSR